MTFTRRIVGLLTGAALIGGLATVAMSPTFAADAAKLAPVYREFVQGNPNAKVVVIEYASLTCPHCALFAQEGMPKLKAEYIDTGKVKFVFRDFPLDGLATGASMLARCAPNDRGKIMIDLMYKNQSEWMRAESPITPLRDYAKLAGMSSDEVDACLKNDPILKEIQDVQEKARTLYKVESTPTFFVGEEKVQGNDYAALKRAIDKAL